MGNSRGTTPWGKGHVSLNVNSKEYWRFTWDEMARYDITANIDFLLKHTGAEKLSYVCHSQGCTSMVAGIFSN